MRRSHVDDRMTPIGLTPPLDATLRAALLTWVLLTYAISHAEALTPHEVATLRGTQTQGTTSRASDAAVALATTIGKEGNFDRVKAVLELPVDHSGFAALMCHAFTVAGDELPPEVESFLIDHYRERAFVPTLLCWFGRRELDDGSRTPRYRTRTLFDLLYGDMVANRYDVGFGYARSIVATHQAGIESRIVDALPLVDDWAKLELVRFLGIRRYVGAAPALASLYRRTFGKRTERSDAERLVVTIKPPGMMEALLRSAAVKAMSSIGTREALRPFVEQVSSLSKRLPDSEAQSDILALLLALSELKVSDSSMFGAIRAALPERLPNSLTSAVATLEAAWKPVESAVVHAEPARAATPDPGMGEPSYERAVDEAVRRRVATALLRERDPARYAMELEVSLDEVETLIARFPQAPKSDGLRRDTAQEATMLAQFVRFTLRDPERAIRLELRSIRLLESAPGSNNLGAYQRASIADTYRFDLRDARSSIAAYDELSQLIAGRLATAKLTPSDAAAYRAMNEQIEAELEYLRNGRRYYGKPSLEAISKEALLLVIASGSPLPSDPALAKTLLPLRSRMPTVDERQKVATMIEALPASQHYLLLTFGLLPVLETPERIDAFLRKHDPAGYQTAVSFAALPGIDQWMASRSQWSPSGLGLGNWTESERELMKRAVMLASKP